LAGKYAHGTFTVVDMVIDPDRMDWDGTQIIEIPKTARGI